LQLKKVTTTSASSIDKFLTCPRKWWLRYVLGQRGDETEAMRHGTMVHKDIEDYYNKKTKLTSLEAIEARSQDLLPERSRVIAVEAKAEDLGLTLHGLDFLGFLDLLYLDDDGKLAIIDWKTRSSFSYAPDAVELLDDTQATLYAWVAFEIMEQDDEIPTSDTVKFSHVNMIRVDGKSGRNSPRSMRSTTIFKRDRVYGWINGQCKTIIGEIQACAALAHPREVKQEKGSCFKYGPCEYKSDPIKPLRGRSCYDIPYEPAGRAGTTASSKGEKAMGLADLMKTKKKTKTPETEVKPEEERASRLEAAKADFLADKNDFEMLEYALSHVEKRDFVLWRREITGKAKKDQDENPIPPVNPPDAAPEEAPVDLEDQSVYDYDFAKVDGIGEKTVEHIQEYLALEGVEDLIELIDHDLKKIHGIGKKGEENLKEAIKQERNWLPEGEEKADDMPDQDAVFTQACKAYRKENSESLETALEGMTPETRVGFDFWIAEHYPGDEIRDTPQPEIGNEKAAIPKQQPAPRILYVDCYPTKGAKAVSLDDLLLPAKAKVCEEENIRYWSADKYGKGRKILLDVILEDPSFLGGADHVVARSDHEGMAVILPEIRQFFDVVIEA